MPDGAKDIYRRPNERGGYDTYPIGSPSLLDRLQGLNAYAYSRRTRDPITFTRGKVSMLEPESVKGLHVGLKQLPPWTHTTAVDATYGNPQDTLAHEDMHHAFDPLDQSSDAQHGYIDGMMSDDERVQDLARRMVPQGTDVKLLDRIMEMRRRRPGNIDDRLNTRGQ